MISYSTYLSVSFTLNSGTITTPFIRSSFDFGVRQRRVVQGYDTFSVRLVLDEDNGEMTEFRALWTALNNGTDKFLTDEVINSDETTAKTVRFISGYSISQIGANKFIVTVPLELIATGA